MGFFGCSVSKQCDYFLGPFISLGSLFAFKKHSCKGISLGISLCKCWFMNVICIDLYRKACLCMLISRFFKVWLSEALWWGLYTIIKSVCFYWCLALFIIHISLFGELLPEQSRVCYASRPRELSLRLQDSAPLDCTKECQVKAQCSFVMFQMSLLRKWDLSEWVFISICPPHPMILNKEMHFKHL